ncbi:MAG: 23S rRNA (adenine(2030)-N(6))-methyltransferase RlmJ, partial [Alphaproteobacteria bacterium]|nr:23S rRNA (adenine(2030)-N(6))-methyltransferase RlmJ [Alphaproteobacteria bacterium]
VLVLIIEYLKRKDKPFCVLDTHAGPGLYDLASTEARKTGEFHHGIERLLWEPSPPPELAPYLGVVQALNGGELRWYPGSPRLARTLLRPDDRLVASELHPEDFATLAANFARDPRTAIHHLDGYQAMRAFLPPRQRRGVVLVDPPFEVGNEFTLLANALVTAHTRWPGGTYVAWYPIKDMVAPFHAALRRSGIGNILVVEMTIRPPRDPVQLNGCGLVILNPPWTLADSLREVMPFLCSRLVREPGGDWKLVRLAEHG